jgi:Leucine-rich repeat (LRR) protein
MMWILKDLKEWISNGCDNKIALQILELDLSYNSLTKMPIEIFNLKNLKILNMSNNNLTTIPDEIDNLINLESINLYDNKLTMITNKIGNLTNLKTLNLAFNKLKIIPAGIFNLLNLNTLCLNKNDLKTIPNEIGNLTKLQILFLHTNKLTILPITIINLINIVNFYFFDNPLEYIPPQVLRHLERNKTTQKIYTDKESVHLIQQDIIQSINYIMSIKPIYVLNNLNKIITNNNFIENQTKTILFEYMNCQDVHDILNITFAELLVSVLSFIDQHEAKVELYKILEQEMNYTTCKCFTSIMIRLINCLNGFDENIVINICDL